MHISHSDRSFHDLGRAYDSLIGSLSRSYQIGRSIIFIDDINYDFYRDDPYSDRNQFIWAILEMLGIIIVSDKREFM